MSDQDLTEITKRAITFLSGVMYGPPELLRAALKPTDEDFAAVFVGEAGKQAAQGYASFWERPPANLTSYANAQIRLIAKRAQDIVASNEFPGGYRKIEHLLVPDHVWCRFRLIGDGGKSVLAYDGLVARGERWAWFPKPWRLFPGQSDEQN